MISASLATYAVQSFREAAFGFEHPLLRGKLAVE
jgi:hypothetical protein